MANLSRIVRWGVWAIVAAVLVVAVVRLLAGTGDDGLELADKGFLAYAVEGPGGANIRFLDVHTGADERVIGEPHDGLYQYCPTFSADGQRLAYLERRGLLQGDRLVLKNSLWVAQTRPDGSVQQLFQLDIEDEAVVECPVWAPAGEHLALPLISGNQSEIRLVAANAAEPSSGRLAGASQPRFSDDGSSLWFVREGSLWRSDALGRQAALVVATTNLSGYDVSPDGRSVAISDGNPDTESNQVTILDTESGEESSVGDEETSELWPVWSPDGVYLAYLAECVDEFCAKTTVVVSATDTSGTTFALSPIEGRCAGGALDCIPHGSVVWAPDASHLAFVTEDFSLIVRSLFEPAVSRIIEHGGLRWSFVMGDDGVERPQPMLNPVSGLNWQRR